MIKIKSTLPSTQDLIPSSRISVVFTPTGPFVYQVTGLTPEQVVANQVALDASLRYIPSLHSSGGVTEALAQVQTAVTDPDMLAETPDRLKHCQDRSGCLSAVA